MKGSLCLRKIAMWQPRPHIAEVKDGYLSWWFYTNTFIDSNLYHRNAWGELWIDFWLKLSKYTRNKEKQNEPE